MGNKYLMGIAFLTITLFVVVLSGCTSQTTSTSTTPTSQAPVSTAVAASNPVGNLPSGAPAVQNSGTTTTVSGSQGGDFTGPVAKGGYLFSIQTQDANYPHLELDFAGNEFNHPAQYSQGASGWYEESFIQGIPVSEGGKFTVKASAPYTITISKVPTGTPLAAPQTFTGKGGKALGPVALKAGKATIDIKSMNTVASFTVNTWDVTKEQPGALANNFESGKIVSDYQAQKTLDVPADGSYYFIVLTSGQNSWQVDVSQ